MSIKHSGMDELDALFPESTAPNLTREQLDELERRRLGLDALERAVTNREAAERLVRRVEYLGNPEHKANAAQQALDAAERRGKIAKIADCLELLRMYTNEGVVEQLQGDLASLRAEEGK